MKLIIDIPDVAYEAYKEWHKNKVATVEQSLIANGIPYEEKPQGDLISRSSLKRAIEQGEGFSWDSHGKDDLCVRKKYIDNAPKVKFSLMPADESKDEAYLRGYEKGKVEGLLRPNGEWIPVSEGLPEEKTKVLITNDKGKVDMIQWDTWWQNQTIYPNHIRAIAWMPLPEPYKETDMRKETENDNS